MKSNQIGFFISEIEHRSPKEEKIIKVKRNTLLLLACLVWSAAGFNILRIGLMSYPAYCSVQNYLLSVLVFIVFQVFIFGRLVKKHTARIIAVFYTGLGGSLLLAGVLFGRNYGRVVLATAIAQNKTAMKGE